MVGGLPVARLTRVAQALEATLVVELRWNGERLDRLLDERHAALVERVADRLFGYGWQVFPEVSFSIYGERGSIDLLAWHPPTRLAIVVEVKSALGDVQDTLATLDRKTRNAPKVARDRELPARAVTRLLVLEDASTTRRRVAAHAITFDRVFPARGAELRRFLRAPSVQDLPAGGLWFLSPGHPVTGKRGTVGRQRVRPPKADAGTHAQGATGGSSGHGGPPARQRDGYQPPQG